MHRLRWVFCLGLLLGAAQAAEEPAGKRPYEMDWAGRVEDNHPALVDFENLDGWTAECREAEARFSQTRQQQLWGRFVGTLTYRGTGPRPVVTVKPPRPVTAPGGFDCVNLWVYGNNWAWVSDPATPPVEIAVLFRAKGGQQVRVPMGRVHWQEWWVMHRRLAPEQVRLLQDGGTLEGIEVLGGRNVEDRVLHFDNLSIYREPLPPLAFEPRPQRNLTLPEGQTTGTNTGPGRLPFPTREETLLPDNLTSEFKVALEPSGGEFAFHYRGKDGHLAYRYRPSTGTLADVTAAWAAEKPFQPLADGGVVFARDAKPGQAPEKPAMKLLECKQAGDTVVSRWQASWDGRAAEVRYTLRLWQKSLVVDVACRGGHVEEFRVGRSAGLENPRLVTLPYLTGDYQHRPAVVVSGPPQKPLFLFALVDHCRSNASALWFANRVADDGVVSNGGSRYHPKTDGRRNDCFERLFLTVSPRFEEVLPNVPNPKSPWMHVAGERLWIAHGASDRGRDFALWKQVARYGMTKVVITDHETGWRDGGESFTFRTRAAPGKGGDEGQADYARRIRALGFRYGIYNNYTDFAPVNEHWNEDLVTRLSDGNWQTAWARCYNPKPARAVEYEARLAPIIQQKFQLDTAYCDVHTAVTPWNYCDHDARVPGAATFAATFYAYGEIMLHQKKTWNGPVYSEGNNHWYYCGLTDGNYGQDQAARLDENPWLVDFDLRKLHPLCCNFGMGNPGMFYGERRGMGRTSEEREARLDRFLAATLAFGHTGFLVMEGGMSHTVRSYYNLQAVHAAYAQATPVEIRYADEKGNLLDTSAAVATGAYKRSQVCTDYSNGLRVYVNGHPTENWFLKDFSATLPPNGWYVRDLRDVQRRLEAWSKLVDGHRADYVSSPEYVYADGRGELTDFGAVVSNGPVIVHRRPKGLVEVVPVGASTIFGVSFVQQPAPATALDEEGKPLGPAETRYSRGQVFVTPVPKAFRYVLGPYHLPKRWLECAQTRVAPGQEVTIQVYQSGEPWKPVKTKEYKHRIPADPKPGSVVWHRDGDQWLHFIVVPLADARLRIEGDLVLELATRQLGPVGWDPVDIRLGESVWRRQLLSSVPKKFTVPLRMEGEKVSPLALTVTSGELRHTQTWWLKTEEGIAPLAAVSERFDGGECLRKGKERPIAGNTGTQAHWNETSSGGVTRRSLFMHPPYMTGPGYAFALLEPVALPKAPAAAFRCLIGKGDGSDPGDGILFRIAIVGPDGKETIAAEKQWIRHAWTPLEADLSPWAGKTVRIKLIADVGPADNSSGDWAAWADLKIESRLPSLVATLHEQPVELLRVPGPHRVEGLAAADLRNAKKGVLHFQGLGLEHSGKYISSASLNGVSLGALPGAGGDEVNGVWAEAAMPIPEKALATLQRWNHLAIDNPGQDCFAVRRFWIELELADGRRASSDVTQAALTQPPEWKYGQGTGVPQGKPIELQIRFPIR